jgi:hypothetical protein
VVAPDHRRGRVQHLLRSGRAGELPGGRRA